MFDKFKEYANKAFDLLQHDRRVQIAAIAGLLFLLIIL